MESERKERVSVREERTGRRRREAGEEKEWTVRGGRREHSVFVRWFRAWGLGSRVQG